MRKVVEKIMMAMAALVTLALLAGTCYFVQWLKEKPLRDQIKDLQVQLSRASIPLERDTIRDSTEVVKQVVVEVEPKKMKEALAADQKLIKDLKLKISQLESMQTMTTETKDSAQAVSGHDNLVFSYDDRWSSLRFSLKDSTFYYNIRDSLSTFVYREYRHRFLWWRWGVKGYRLKIVNFNPHTQVIYNRYIKSEK